MAAVPFERIDADAAKLAPANAILTVDDGLEAMTILEQEQGRKQIHGEGSPPAPDLHPVADLRPGQACGPCGEEGH